MMLAPLALAIASLFASTVHTAEHDVVGTTWGPGRMDLFGVNSAGDIWHKFYTHDSWQPDGVEVFGKAYAAGPVSATSRGSDRLDFVFIDTSGEVQHKYWTGSEWKPSGNKYESLGKGPVSGLTINSWGKGRLDLVGLGDKGQYLHKAWTGKDWYPSGDDWEDLGGPFSSPAALASWSKGRLDIFGVSELGTVSHKYWNQDQWVPDGKVWEDLGGANFTGTPVASTMEEGRLDVWTVENKTGELYHLFYDKDSAVWRGWENLGGEFSDAPQVAHWTPNRIDLLGYGRGDAYIYLYKYWDGSQWSDWDVKGSDFVSEPALITLGERNLNMFGVDYDGNVKLQVWAWDQWLPSYFGWYDIANITLEEKVVRHGCGKSTLPKLTGDEIRIEIDL